MHLPLSARPTLRIKLADGSMPDILTPDQRHELMSHIHSKDTKPEWVVRRELWRRGYRYRLNVRSLPGSPDIVLPKYRTVIFINGCFWHGHKDCPNYTLPKTNVAFWQEKIARNRQRDLLNDQRLESLAWSVVTVWECEITKPRLPGTMQRIEEALCSNRAKWQAYKDRRRQDRLFAIAQARTRREILARVQAELAEQFEHPVRFGRTT